MQKNLPEGFDFMDMPRFIGWGKILTPSWLQERYFSLRAFGWALFICRCHANYLAADLDTFTCHCIYGGVDEAHYWRWWLRRVADPR